MEKSRLAGIVATILFGLGSAGTSIAAEPQVEVLSPLAPSTGYAGTVLQAPHLLVVTTHHANAVVHAAMGDESGIPVFILCDDEVDDAVHCTIAVHPFDPATGACGDRIAGQVSEGLGLQIVQTRIPRDAYAGEPLSLFCVNPGIAGVTVGNPTIFTVIGP